VLSLAACSDDGDAETTLSPDTSSSTDTMSASDMVTGDDVADDAGSDTIDDASTGDDAATDMVTDGGGMMVEPADYADLGNWLCHPDLAADDNVCEISLDVTMVAADGTATVEPHPKAVDPAFDCFYVYPTISTDFRVNSDLQADEAEIFVTRFQAARYGEVCRVFAPMYQQVTLAGLFKNVATPQQRELLDMLVQGDPDPEVAYTDVAAAFQRYLDSDSNGRPFLLIGHSRNRPFASTDA